MGNTNGSIKYTKTFSYHIPSGEFNHKVVVIGEQSAQKSQFIASLKRSAPPNLYTPSNQVVFGTHDELGTYRAITITFVERDWSSYISNAKCAASIMSLHPHGVVFLHRSTHFPKEFTAIEAQFKQSGFQGCRWLVTTSEDLENESTHSTPSTPSGGDSPSFSSRKSTHEHYRRPESDQILRGFSFEGNFHRRILISFKQNHGIVEALNAIACDLIEKAATLTHLTNSECYIGVDPPIIETRCAGAFLEVEHFIKLTAISPCMESIDWTVSVVQPESSHIVARIEPEAGTIHYPSSLMVRIRLIGLTPNVEGWHSSIIITYSDMTNIDPNKKQVIAIPLRMKYTIDPEKHAIKTKFWKIRLDAIADAAVSALNDDALKTYDQLYHRPTLAGMASSSVAGQVPIIKSNSFNTNSISATAKTSTSANPTSTGPGSEPIKINPQGSNILSRVSGTLKRKFSSFPRKRSAGKSSAAPSQDNYQDSNTNNSEFPSEFNDNQSSINIGSPPKENTIDPNSKEEISSPDPEIQIHTVVSPILKLEKLPLDLPDDLTSTPQWTFMAPIPMDGAPALGKFWVTPSDPGSSDFYLAQRKAWESELSMILDLNHKNIAYLLGASSPKEKFERRLFILFPQFSHGNLAQFLASNPRVSFFRRIDLAFQIATALEYCHSKGISINRLDASQVLLDDDYNPILWDFSRSSIHYPSNNSTNNKTSILLEEEPFWSEDVRQFGFLMCHLITGQVPYKFGSTYANDDGSSSVLPRSIIHSIRPYYDLVMSCQSTERKIRPSISHVARSLSVLLQSMICTPKFFVAKESTVRIIRDAVIYRELKKSDIIAEDGKPEFLILNQSHLEIQVTSLFTPECQTLTITNNSDYELEWSARLTLEQSSSEMNDSCLFCYFSSNSPNIIQRKSKSSSSKNVLELNIYGMLLYLQHKVSEQRIVELTFKTSQFPIFVYSFSVPLFIIQKMGTFAPIGNIVSWDFPIDEFSPIEHPIPVVDQSVRIGTFRNNLVAIKTWNPIQNANDIMHAMELPYFRKSHRNMGRVLAMSTADKSSGEYRLLIELKSLITLHEWLHNPTYPKSGENKLWIAIGIARALDHLHQLGSNHGSLNVNSIHILPPMWDPILLPFQVLPKSSSIAHDIVAEYDFSVAGPSGLTVNSNDVYNYGLVLCAIARESSTYPSPSEKASAELSTFNYVTRVSNFQEVTLSQKITTTNNTRPLDDTNINGGGLTKNDFIEILEESAKEIESKQQPFKYLGSSSSKAKLPIRSDYYLPPSTHPVIQDLIKFCLSFKDKPASISTMGEILGQLSTLASFYKHSYPSPLKELISTPNSRVSIFKEISSSPLDPSHFNWMYSDLSHVNMEDIDLSFTSMAHCVLDGVDFSKATLSSPQTGNRLIAAASLHHSSLVGSLLPSKLTAVDLSYTDLSAFDLSQCDLRHANLSYCKLKGTKLPKELACANLSHVDLLDMDLTETNIEGCILDSCKNVSTAKLPNLLIGVSFCFTTDWNNYDFSNSNIDGCAFSHAELQGVKLPKRLFRIKFDNVDLSGFDLSDSVLNQCDFTNAKLKSTRLPLNLVHNCWNGCKLHEAIMSIYEPQSHFYKDAPVAPHKTVVVLLRPSLGNSYIQSLSTSLVYFAHPRDTNIDNQMLALFPATLKHLDLRCNPKISDEGLKNLPTVMWYLNLHSAQIFGTTALPTALEFFDIGSSNGIMASFFFEKLPPTITDLRIGSSRMVDTPSMASLPLNITFLDISNSVVTDFSTAPRSITHLDLRFSVSVNDNSILSLPRSLTYLNLKSATLISDGSRKFWPPNLQFLDLSCSTLISFHTFEALPKTLTHLNLRHNKNIQDEGLGVLTRELKYLDIHDAYQISFPAGINMLPPNLTFLDITSIDIPLALVFLLPKALHVLIAHPSFMLEFQTTKARAAAASASELSSSMDT